LVGSKILKISGILTGVASIALALSAFSRLENSQYFFSDVELQIPQNNLGFSQDSIPDTPYTPSRRPTYDPEDRYGDPFIYRPSSSPLFLKDDNSLKIDVEIDTATNYNIYERIGSLNYRPPASMSFSEFDEIYDARMRKEYWKERSAGLDGESAVSGKRLIPPIYMSPAFDRIFGGSFVDIRPNGFVTLDFGGRWQRIQNPSIPIRQQRNGGFEFDQQISMNVVGKIGEKLAITSNFDNNNSFDFQNNLKVEYTGFEEEIIQKIEIGNVSLPINNSLMSGAQNLFGVKTQLRFGKLWVTAVASTQRGTNDFVEVNTGLDGGQGRPFELRGSNYDENRHFFLAHFFRDNYESWLRNIPQILSGVNITRVEVYVINRQNNTQTLRNFAAFMDLGEGRRIYRRGNPRVGEGDPSSPAANNANDLFRELNANPGLRNLDLVNDILSQSFNFEKATDYEVITSARKLDDREYIVNRQLGVVSLVRRLQNDEALAVAFEYSYQGRNFKVGELQTDYQGRRESDVIFLKMLRPTKIDTRVPSWDLMMKNIYNLNASQVTREGFQLRVIYRDDRTGIDNPSLHEGRRIRDVPLIEVMGLDRLNINGDPQKDGNFDFVEGVTILPETGTVIFPVLEPFGSHLRRQFDPETEAQLINKYVYDTLYRTTKADAELEMTRNKFFIEGRMQGGSSSEIALPGINISPGSIVVTAGNQPLVEGVDYRVDYTMGRVTILNESVLNSGRPIRVQYEKADLFNFQTRSLLGTRLDYRISDNFNIGGTFLYHNERPLISRISIGDEPTRNMKYGFDISYQSESRLLTRMVDAIPLIQTKEPSAVSFNAEFAQLLPGTSNRVQGEGASYIDDFEASAIPFNLGNNWNNWRLASTPVTADQRFTGGANVSNNLEFGYKRAKLAWYIVDPIFYRTIGQNIPANIDDDDRFNYHYGRGIAPREILKNRDEQVVETYMRIFDLAYFPSERGSFNYNPDLIERDGVPLLKEPRNNWGGVTRAITSDVDFDRNNIEYIEFWMMDPFINSEFGRIFDGLENTVNSTGGKLYFNLGSVSEDVIKDNRHFFENGLPPDGDTSRAVTTAWGRAPRNQYLANGFSDSPQARAFQDIGLDGIRNDEEATFYNEFLDQLNISPNAREVILNDVSADNFRFYLGNELDQQNMKIVERYKDFNNTEGNTPVISGQSIAQAGSNYPDNEDLNRDNTISDLEEYYEYELDLRPGNLQIGRNNIVDRVTNTVAGDEVNWYLFRIPIRRPTRTQGNISGFKSIRFVRMYLSDFAQPVVLRMANFQMVGSQWRKFEGNLYQRGLFEQPEPYEPNFVVDVVNIEENGSPTDGKIPYIEPPGIIRDLDNTSPVRRRLNEQSLRLTIDNLRDKDARAVYKNFNLDLINYGRIKMFFHAQENSMPLQDGEVSAFIRFGTDFLENYYEVEVPLKITRHGAISAEEIWPQENEVDIKLDDLYTLKTRRNIQGISIDLPYSDTLDNGHIITVEGRPEVSAVQTIMIGIRNPNSPDEQPKSVTVWANELRVTDFDREAGWAANAFLNAKLADFAVISASTRYTTFGFGGIQSRISERTREEILEYDVSANVNLDKFIPERAGIKIPLFVGFENRIVTPRFDPLDPDIRLEASLLAFDTEEQQNDYRRKVQDRMMRRSFNFTNVRKVKTNPEARNNLWDIENFSFTYAFSEVRQSNINTESYLLNTYRGSVAYNYNIEDKNVAPFKNSEALSGKYLQLIKDFNFSPLPSNLSFRTDLDRRFARTQLRNADLTTLGIAPMWEKYFTFNRMYGLRWNLTKNIGLDYNARTLAIIDEPDGDITTEQQRQEIWERVKGLGRMRNFNQNLGINYRLPLDKIPLTDFLGADVRYAVGYTWNAGAFSPIDSLNQQKILGNIAQNNRDVGITGKIDFVKLYNKSKYLQKINTPPRRRPGAPVSTARPQPRPQAQQQAAEDTVKQKENKALKGIIRALMGIRNVNANFTVRDGTMLPGFTPQPFLLGMNEEWSSPGWRFLMGSQDPGIRQMAAANSWLVYDTLLTTPFTQMRQYDLTLRASIEPFNDLKIQLDARKSAMGNYEELFRVDQMPEGAQYVGLSPSRTGTYNITFSMIRTSLRRNSEDNSATFNQFEQNLTIIKNRLDAENGFGEYSERSQDVLVPAFINAYAGKDARTANISPFPRIPIPGWRADYAGLNKLPGFQDIFAQFNLTHGYRSSFQITNFNNSLEYNQGLELNNNLINFPQSSILNEQGELIPIFLFGQVVIQEEFNPLIGINFRTKSALTTRAEYKVRREMALNISNAQVTELTSNDVSIDIGYTKAKMRLPFRSQGRVITLENDITFKFNFMIRDTKTVQRKIDDEATVTNGNINFQFRPQISYVVSQRLNVNIYFDRNVNTPFITSSFPRATTAFGAQLRFSLAD
jgi:cell surface protein SprA